jgi:hypothetical protein
MIDMLKKCNGPCNKELPFDSFHKGNGKFKLKSRCKDCCKISYKPRAANYHIEYYRRNKELISTYKNAYRERNLDKCRNIAKDYDRRHKAERCARENFRRAQKLKATPPWLTNEHKRQIVEIYRERDRLTLETGIIYHVDHIYPLVHDKLCGLHVPWNLQILPAGDNLSKGNKVNHELV